MGRITRTQSPPQSVPNRYRERRTQSDRKAHVQLGLSTTTQRGWAVLHVDGEIDLASAPRLRQEVINLVAGEQSHIVLDLSDVAFCDSTGIGVLVGAVKRARTAGGDVRVVCGNERLLSMFDITRLDRVFDVFPDVDAALPDDTGGGSW